MDISAPAISLADRPHMGPFGSILSRARSGKIGLSWSLSVVATNRRRRLGCKWCSRNQAVDLLGIDDHPSMTELSANPAIAIGLKLIADRRDIGDDLSVVSLHRWCVVIGRTRQADQAASFGDGDAVGPVKTDVLALLGRGMLFSAPFRNSISRACLPTIRSSAAIFASYS